MQNHKYQLGSKYGVIDVYYCAGKLELLNAAEFSELNVITKRIMV